MSTTEIIVVNWNNRRETLACVGAVEAQLGDAGGASITVVDNGSTDGSVTALAAQHPRVKLFALRENRGFTGGLAAALAGSDATNVVFLNNDAVPEPGWLAALVRAIDDASDDVVSVGGKIVDPTGQQLDFIGGVLTFDGHAFQNGFRYPVGSRDEPRSGDELLFACGGNMISRRAKLAELGGFDGDYFAYLEDVDFGWRTWIAGGRVLFEPRALVRHASSTTSNRLGDFERGVLFERNALQTAMKNYEDLAASGASVFYTYLHRLHHYATTRNARANELTRAAIGELHAPRRPSRAGFVQRLRNRAMRPPLAAIDDPLTAMQFRALDWIFRNEARLAEKRADVQRRRKRSDAEIFERFPLHVVPTYPGDDALLRGPIFSLLRPRLRSVDRELGDIIRA
ncbi:MAG: glycosyltransferase family 2 protein [Acidobacteria bacterium]|nr:glycosyltransferase family 2 protein [Acidobacteriota bacterium]MBV9476434.1 glycosyltransferase family 2 protein [Acidobacteriota bacterium]